ncbi:MAG: hypothetical protein IT355_09200 [Gemmatimonadaceae bacterium]|nr:hypothetical protein [Gemmatimonadaceae bacterium]
MTPFQPGRRTAQAIAVSLVLLPAACSSSLEPSDVGLRLTSAVTVGTTAQQLQVAAIIENRTDGTFRSAGCLRPELVIDSLTPSGTWVVLDARQLDDLASCAAPFNVAPGTSQPFQTAFVRSDTAARFPRGVSLRLRAVPVSLGNAPAVRFALP